MAIPEPAAWTITAALTALLVGGLWSYGSARVAVDQGWLYVGKARIETKFVGVVQALDATQTRATAGPLADARAFLLLRPYLREAAQIFLTDPTDPTPYWLVSSRHVEALGKALHDAKAPHKLP